jgi:hypothetical protein
MRTEPPLDASEPVPFERHRWSRIPFSLPGRPRNARTSQPLGEIAAGGGRDLDLPPSCHLVPGEGLDRASDPRAGGLRDVQDAEGLQ